MNIMYYMIVLAIAGAVAGTIIGVLSGMIIKNIRNLNKSIAKYGMEKNSSSVILFE